MSKNIVICSDGTGNTTIKGRGTNVFKLYEALDTSLRPSRGPVQVAFYDDGIGTENVRWFSILTGAIGWGLGRNIRKLYVELARVYDPEDKIYLFGFSRGAFTVRMLARMIETCGIPKIKDKSLTKKDLEGLAKAIYRHFLTLTDPPVLNKLYNRFLTKKDSFDTYDSVKIKFIGVWDTVDAVGLPTIGKIINDYIWRFKAIDCDRLGGVDPVFGSVERACHALAIDEERAAFEPLLWHEGKCSENDKKKIEQVWFAGVHSNVGGGYPRQGISLVALDWMMSKAVEKNLRFIRDQRDAYHGLQNVNDRLYDSRSGVQVLYEWEPRDIDQICEENGIEKARIHISVFERLALRPEGYAPSNIPKDFEIVSTDDSLEDITKKYATKVQEKYGKIDEKSLLAALKNPLNVGYLSYWLFMAAVVGAIVGVVLLVSWFVITRWLSTGDASPEWLTRFISGPSFKWFVEGEFILFVLAWSLSYYADQRFELRCAKFWHEVQPDLQKILGLSPQQSPVVGHTTDSKVAENKEVPPSKEVMTPNQSVDLTAARGLK
jgi:uncharacterized protein (DUF2235 family)